MRRVTKQRAIASAASWRLGLPHVSHDSLSVARSSPRCSPLPAVRARRPPSTASRRCRPRPGPPSRPASARRSRCEVKGAGQVCVHVCKSKKKDKDGRDLLRRGASGRPRRRAARSASSRSSSTSPSSGSTRRAPTTGRPTASTARAAIERLPAGRAGRQVQGRVADAAVRIGCSGWNYAHWRETFYPPRLPARRWLEHYATLFDTVEVNSTFTSASTTAAVAGGQLLRHRVAGVGRARARPRGLADVFAYFNNDWEVSPPRNAERLRALVNLIVRRGVEQSGSSSGS